MDLEKNKQRLEILAAEVEELKNSGGGGGDLSDYLTKAEASSTYETQSAASSALELKADKATTYTKTEVDSAIAAAGGDLDLSPVYMGVALSNNVEIPADKRYALEKHLPITFDSSTESTRDTYIFVGSRNNSSNPYQSYYFYVNSTGQGFKLLQISRGSYRVIFYGKTTSQYLDYVDNSKIRRAMFDPTMWDNLNYNGTSYSDGKAASISANSDLSNSGFATGNGCGLYRASAAVVPTLLNCPTTEAFYLITDKYAEDGANKYSQTIVENSGARIFKRGKNSDNSWTNWHLVGCDYFNPADETLTDGGTISATALADALRHLPLSFNAHLCYYSYEDTNNVYYVSTRLNGTSLHTNVVAINKTTGVATFNEFDQS